MANNIKRPLIQLLLWGVTQNVDTRHDQILTITNNKSKVPPHSYEIFWVITTQLGALILPKGNNITKIIQNLITTLSKVNSNGCTKDKADIPIQQKIVKLFPDINFSSTN